MKFSMYIYEESVRSRREIEKLADLIISNLVRLKSNQLLLANVMDYYKKTGDGLLNDFLNAFMNTNIVVRPKLTGRGGGSYSFGGDKAITVEIPFEKKEDLDRYKNQSKDYTSLLTRYKNIFVHELTHAYDDYRSKGEALKDGRKDSPYDYDPELDGYTKYLRKKYEIDARLAQFLSNPDAKIAKLDGSAATYRQHMFNNYMGWSAIDRKQQVNIIKKINQEYYDLSVHEQKILKGKMLKPLMWDVAIGENPDFAQAKPDSRLGITSAKRIFRDFWNSLKTGDISSADFRPVSESSGKAPTKLDRLKIPYADEFFILSEIFGYKKDSFENDILPALKKINVSQQDMENIYNRYFKTFGVEKKW